MKVTAILLTLAFAARATPIMDTGVGTITPTPVTVVRDDQNASLYYYFPTAYGVHRGSAGKAEFAYTEYDPRFSGPIGVAVMTMAVEFDPNLALKLEEIKKGDANAVFTPIVLSQGAIDEGKIKLQYVSDSECQEFGGVIGQQIGCKFVVKSKYRQAFVRGMRASQIHQFYYTYEFAGIRNGKTEVFKHSVPIKFGDLGEGNYFLDKNGNPIKD